VKKSGAQILVECLHREKVEIIFGIPGGVLLPIFDVLYDAPVKVILTKHEQGAVHAADGYARTTGRVGVCIATSGPGATNLVTGIANAYMDSVPLVALTGQVATNLIGNDAFQEADTTGITRPITKQNYLIKDVNRLAPAIREAFYLAATGRPGPVLIDIPVDVSRAQMDFHYPEKVELRGYKPTYAGHPGQIKKAAEKINQAKQPIIYAGGGIMISGASKELTELAEKASIPVDLTLLGLGGFPGTSPLFLGMLGMHGTKTANYAISEADLVIAVGARFDDRVTGRIDHFAPRAEIIHIDIDPSAISKNVRVDIPIVGDAKHVLSELVKLVEEKKHTAWLKKINEWKEKHPVSYDRKGGLKPQFIIEQVYEISKGKAIVTTDVGQHQMWTAQFYKFDYPGHFVSSGGLGTMGFGFPAAIGAQFGNPHQVVFNITGDGSFQMNLQELATAVEHKLPVKIVIMNNRYLGMVRQWQEFFYHRRYSSSNISVQPDFVRLAEAYGASGIRVEKPEEVRPALERALKITDKPCLLDCHIDREENVFPMVPAGSALHEMIDRSLA